MKNGLILALILIVSAAALILLDPSKSPKTDAAASQTSNTTSPSPDDKPVAKIPPSEPTDFEVATDPEMPARQRVQALAKLSNELSAEEVKGLRAVIDDNEADEVVRNDALETLERQKIPPKAMGQQLIRIYDDEKTSAKMKDFVIQHMEPVYTFDPSENSKIRAKLVELSEGNDGDAATALMSLERLAEKHPEFRGAVERARERTLANEEASTPMLLTALHSAANTNDDEGLERARKIAMNPSSEVRLRMAAINVIGKKGQPKDVSLLESLSQHEDSRINRAAKLHLASLGKRLDGSSTN